MIRPSSTRRSDPRWTIRRGISQTRRPPRSDSTNSSSSTTPVPAGRQRPVFEEQPHAGVGGVQPRAADGPSRGDVVGLRAPDSLPSFRYCLTRLFL